MMNFKKNWKWYLVNLIALLPLLPVLGQFNFDFTGSGPFISIQMPSAVPEMQNAGAAFHGGRPRSSWGLSIHTTGEWAIRWLTACLTITPLITLFGWKIQRYRKLFGLYAFGYAFLHALFFCFDRGILPMFGEFNFILGLIALLIMLPLALTSNKWSMIFMGHSWKPMQRLVYAAAICTVLHVLILGKGWEVYAVIMAIGFVLRIPAVKERFKGLRSPRPELSVSNNID